MLSGKLKSYLRSKTWMFLKAKWKLQSGLLIKIENDSDWFVFNEIFTNKEYDKAIQLFLPAFSKQPLILDLGANVGYFTLRMADELIQAGFDNYEIVSLEASPSNYISLRNRLDQPSLKNKVKPFLGLAGYKTGSDKVIHSDQHYGHATHSASTGNKITEVSYLDIEGLLTDTTKNIDLLKCDIECSEEIFLAAYPGLLKKVNHAVFEFHAGECNIDNCRKLLREACLFSKGLLKEEAVYKTSVEIFSRQ